MKNQFCCSGPASEQSRRSGQSRRLQAESDLPHLKPRHKSHNLRQSDNQLSEIGSNMRDLSHQEEARLMQSESNMSMASYGDTEVTSAHSYSKIEGRFYPKHENKQNNPVPRFSEGDPTAEPSRTALEQPSSVSVLDATFFLKMNHHLL